MPPHPRTAHRRTAVGFGDEIAVFAGR
ncbi:hypothetical protein ACTIVE_5977 [Actinomadura verrucosospora]|uniref:Uncharacterized protein n=1 Tax=Actinomadura verrucosospora TaxID=46165 RepID=A0A7D3VYR1_ACTVE|nr:hypothetical protein ACTIVE_5977 [Actinomadura verrucosospora]